MITLKVAIPNSKIFPHLAFKKVWAKSQIFEFLTGYDISRCLFNPTESINEIMIYEIDIMKMSKIDFTKLQLSLKDEEILEVIGKLE